MSLQNKQSSFESTGSIKLTMFLWNICLFAMFISYFVYVNLTCYGPYLGCDNLKRHVSFCKFIPGCAIQYICQNKLILSDKQTMYMHSHLQCSLCWHITLPAVQQSQQLIQQQPSTARKCKVQPDFKVLISFNTTSIVH